MSEGMLDQMLARAYLHPEGPMPMPVESAWDQMARRVRRSGPRGTPEELTEAMRAEAAETAAAAEQMPGGLAGLGAYRMADLATPFPAIGRLMGYSPDVGMDPSLVGDALTAGLFGVGAAVPAVRALRGGRQAAEATQANAMPAALAQEGLSSPALTRAMLDLPPEPIGTDFNFALPGTPPAESYAQRLLQATGLPERVFVHGGSYGPNRALTPAVEAFQQGPLSLQDALTAQELALMSRSLIGQQGNINSLTRQGEMDFSRFSPDTFYRRDAQNLGADFADPRFANLFQNSRGEFLPEVPTTIRLNTARLTEPPQAVNVFGHELGHAVDMLGGATPNIAQLSGGDLSRFVSEALVDPRWLRAFPDEFAPPAAGSMLGAPQAVSPEMFNLVRQRAVAPGNLPNRSSWLNYAAAPEELVAQALGNQFTSGREGITQQLLLDALQAPALRGRVQMQ